MGTNHLETGDCQWHGDMKVDLSKSIDKELQQWVTKRPPFGYDTSKPTDMQFWFTRRQRGITWTQSVSGLQFAKTVFQTYVEIFSSVTKDQSHSTFHLCLEKFYHLRRIKEQGDLRHLLQALLLPIGLSCGCTETNVVDKFSFVTGNLFRAVFDFFTIKVKKAPEVKAPKRLKDREDDAKTYYVCGCVWRSLHTRAKGKKALLSALDGMTISAAAAAAKGLPTRHVTIKNRGGLVFASVEYYQLMCKIEDCFYSTVGNELTATINVYFYYCFAGHDARQLHSGKA